MYACLDICAFSWLLAWLICTACSCLLLFIGMDCDPFAGFNGECTFRPTFGVVPFRGFSFALVLLWYIVHQLLDMYIYIKLSKPKRRFANDYISNMVLKCFIGLPPDLTETCDLFIQNLQGYLPGTGTIIRCVHDDVIKWKHFPRYWPLCGEFTGPRWIPRTKASDAELWYYLWSASEQTLE